MDSKYRNQVQLLMILSGIGLIIGSMLPWDIFQTIYLRREIYFKPGYLCGGLYIELIGLFILIISYFHNEKADRILSIGATILGLLSGLIVVFHIITVHPFHSNVLPYTWISIGPGYYVDFISSILAVLGGIGTYHRIGQGLNSKPRICLSVILIMLYIATNFAAGVIYMVAQHSDSYSGVAAIAKSELPHYSTDKSVVYNLASHTDLIWIGLPISINWINIENYQYHYFDPDGNGVYVTNNSLDGYFCWALDDMGLYYQLRGPFTLC
jgi:hypothetical protein